MNEERERAVATDVRSRDKGQPVSPAAASGAVRSPAPALAVFRLSSRRPKTLSKQERADYIAMNRDLVDEYSNALLRAYREIFNFLLAANRSTTFDAVAEIIKAITHEHKQTRQMIKETNGLVQRILLGDTFHLGCPRHFAAGSEGKTPNGKVINSPLPGRKETGKESKQRKG